MSKYKEFKVKSSKCKEFKVIFCCVPFIPNINNPNFANQTSPPFQPARLTLVEC